jgi:hypothetical protein
MQVTIPGHIECSGTSAAAVADSTRQGTYSVSTDNSTLLLSLNLLLAGMSAIPTIDRATLASFGTAVTLAMGAGIAMNGSFTRATGSGLQGSWAFSGLSLDASAQAIIAQYGLQSLVDSTVGSLAGTSGHRILFLDITADSITTKVEKQWYGEKMVMGITDTTHVGIAVTMPDLSHWLLVGKTASDTVRVAISNMGDLDYTSSKAAYTAYTYHLHALSCPDDQAPGWWQTFLTANPH